MKITHNLSAPQKFVIFIYAKSFLSYWVWMQFSYNCTKPTKNVHKFPPSWIVSQFSWLKRKPTISSTFILDQYLLTYCSFSRLLHAHTTHKSVKRLFLIIYYSRNMRMIVPCFLLEVILLQSALPIFICHNESKLDNLIHL